MSFASFCERLGISRAGASICDLPVLVKKPSAGALFFGFIPFAAMCFSVSLWDRIDPMLFGLPFNLFWLICWIVLTAVCLSAAYRWETARDKRAAAPDE